MDIVMNARKESYTYRASWFQLIRPLTLTGTISPALVGTALAAQKGNLHVSYFIAILVAMLLIQMAVNICNDYFDFKNGQDCEKWTEGKVGAHTPEYHQLPIVAGGMLGIAAIIGIWLVVQSEWWILIVGVLGMLFGVGYSAGKRSLSSIGLGELVAAIFLGLAATILPYVVQGNTVDGTIVFPAILFALLISSMILTNNIRDIEKDTGFRRTIAIILGRKWAIRLLSGILLSIYVWLIILLFIGILPWISVLSILALPLAIKLRWSLRKGANQQEKKIVMKWVAYHHSAFGLMLALSLFLLVM
ncbi:prenyltransferase [Virgibacillus sp. W0181]|uniref:prenyltransferase n=1 Tax=Virgibacillus sp. W0181 TaxID=3391581 RepID=UPI003F45C932